MAITTRHFRAYTYCVHNRITGQYYYGFRSRNVKLERTPFEDLWVHYFTSSTYIKQLIKQYGVDSFDVSILKEAEIASDCYRYEQELIKEHIVNPLCLNKRYVDVASGSGHFSFTGGQHTPEAISKIRQARATQIITDQHRANMSTAGKQKVFTESHRAALALSQQGKTLSAETKTKISNTKKGSIPWNKGIEMRTESKEKISRANKGRVVSEEHKKKLSDAAKAQWQRQLATRQMGVK